MAQAEIQKFLEVVSGDPKLREKLERAHGHSEFLETSVEIAKKLDLSFRTSELDKFLERTLEKLDDRGKFDFGPLQAWTDGCGGSICTVTHWTNTYSGCGNVADVRKKAGIR
jgi:hypothetical protein